MATKSKIQDAGEKLGGARKDLSESFGPNGQALEVDLLGQLWPRPGCWTEVISEIGAQRSAMCMVVYENLAPRPHEDGHFMLTGQQWDVSYRFAVRLICDLLTGQGKTEFSEMASEYTARMKAFGLKMFGPSKAADYCVYAAGKTFRRTTKHPFSLTPIDDLRLKYLHLWGWGSDERVSDRLSMGALKMRTKRTGATFWHAVKGVAGQWEYLEKTEFPTEGAALDCTRGYVAKLLEPTLAEKKERKKAPTWVRPFASGANIREGFAGANSAGKTELDLISTFGFRGVEFGNWVTQAQRQWFVDAVYDACLDLTQLLGLPSSFASLNGLLGLAYGSRGEGLSRFAAHFEPGNWVLHLTKESGPGAFAHEFAHAWDCWMADRFWGERRQRVIDRSRGKPGPGALAGLPLFLSEQRSWDWRDFREMGVVLNDWHEHTKDYGQGDKWQWVRVAEEMDVGRKVYWSEPCELFARSFEVLVLESLAMKGKHNDMLVFGICEADGQEQLQKGNPFPYPLGVERAATCRMVAAMLRVFKAGMASRAELKMGI